MTPLAKLVGRIVEELESLGDRREGFAGVGSASLCWHNEAASAEAQGYNVRLIDDLARLSSERRFCDLLAP
jgi:hypothetical protein